MTSEKTTHTLHLDAARWRREPASEKEAAARAAIEARAGHPISDLEWGRVRARLLEFASVLRVWHQESQAGESEPRKAA
jgi:hypothetical protein